MKQIQTLETFTAGLRKELTWTTPALVLASMTFVSMAIFVEGEWTTRMGCLILSLTCGWGAVTTWMHQRSEDAVLLAHTARPNRFAYLSLVIGAAFFYAGQMNTLLIFLAIVWLADSGEKTRRKTAQTLLSAHDKTMSKSLI